MDHKKLHKLVTELPVCPEGKAKIEQILAELGYKKPELDKPAVCIGEVLLDRESYARSHGKELSALARVGSLYIVSYIKGPFMGDNRSIVTVRNMVSHSSDYWSDTILTHMHKLLPPVNMDLGLALVNAHNGSIKDHILKD